MVTQRAVVITGASTGIGAACALHLDRLGWRVFAGVRREPDGEALKNRAAGALTPLRIDVTDADTIRTALVRVAGEVGPAGLAGLVNNAGIVVAAPMEFVPLDDFRRQLEVNVTGPLAVTQAFLELLRAGRGRVVNIGSVNGLIGAPGIGPYCASKHALESLTASFRMELSPWGIEASIVDPGAIATPIWEKSSAASGEIIHKLPRRVRELYSEMIRAAQTMSEQAASSAISPDFVARAVEHALTTRHPKARYMVGNQAKFVAALVRMLPNRSLEALVLRRLGWPKGRATPQPRADQ